MSKMPLEGIRILDIGMMIAVPHAVKLLADMGAEVLKIESFYAHHPTNRSLTFPENTPGERWWTQGGYTAEFNRNRRSLALDLANPKGHDIFIELVKISDIVTENYTPRAMRNLGIDYPSLKKINPGIIVLSSSGYGQSGPWQNYGGIGTTLEPTGGLSALTGIPDGQPSRPMIAYSDNPAGVSGAFALLAALHYRRLTGKGQWIDLAQYENQVTLIGEQLLDYAMNDRLPARLGNHDSSMVPQGVYRCAGSDNWIAIACPSDEDFAALCDVMGQPELATDSRFADLLSRYDHQDDLDLIIQAWTLPQDHYALFHRLQAAGIPAGPVLCNKEILLNPHLKAREMFIPLTFDPGAENVGTRIHRNLAWKLAKTPGSVRMPAPWLGQHNREILSMVLGMSDQEIDGLEADTVISQDFIGAEGRLWPAPPLDELKEQGRIESYDPNFMEILGLKSSREPALEEVR